MDKEHLELVKDEKIPESIRSKIADSALGVSGAQQKISAPFAAALAGLITLSATFVFDNLTSKNNTQQTITLNQLNQALEDSEARLKQELEVDTKRVESELQASADERKFQFELVKELINKPGYGKVESAEDLLFLARAGVLTQLNPDELAAMAREQIDNPDARIIPTNLSHTPFGVIGGTPASAGMAPWRATIFINYMPDADDNRSVCDGALVSEKWVLTAGHCISELSGAQNLSVQVRGENREPGPQWRGIEKVVVHPEFTMDYMPDWDAALLELSAPVKTIASLQIASGELETEGDELARVFASAYKENGSRVDELHFVDLPVVSRNRCRAIYSNLTEQMICMGYIEGGADSCHGTAGAVAVVTREERQAALGLVSWGLGCGKAGSPGVYTYLPGIRDWIESTIQQ